MTHEQPPLWMRQVLADLVRHEGFREYAYPDPLSKIGRLFNKRPWGYEPGDVLLKRYGLNWLDGRPWTVGFGFTRQVHPHTRISRESGIKLLEQVVLEHLPVLDKMLPKWRDLPLFAKTVVVNMAFNLGSRLLQFRNSMAAIGAGNYDIAARNLRKSLWAKQVGGRATELITRLERRAIAKQHQVV